MADYILAAKAGTNSKIDEENLTKLIKKFWPSAEITWKKHDSIQYLNWNYKAKNNLVFGNLFADKPAIILSGDLRDCADFVIKIWPHISRGLPFYFFDEGYTTEVKINSEIKLDDLVRIFSAP